MAKKRRTDSNNNSSQKPTESPSSVTATSRHARTTFMTTTSHSYGSQLGTSGGSRRRATLLKERHGSDGDGTMWNTGQKVKEINAATALEKAQMYGVDATDGRARSSRLWAMAGKILFELVPAWFAVGAMVGLIFGGCCANVFALEAIIKVEPDSGSLLTFVQFIFVASTGYISQFDSSRPPLFLRPNKVPIKRWLVSIVLFFSINVLNNHAFGYDISVPIHIILRSGGSITTITAGYMVGKRYTRTQVFSVLLLTIGVIFAAWSDARSKEESAKTQGVPPFSMGLIVLFIAQVLAAIMGLYTEETYRKYGPHWRENLFYSHLLSLPLFIPFIPNMRRKFLKLAHSPPLALAFLQPYATDPAAAATNVPDTFPLSFLPGIDALLAHVVIPSQIAYLIANVLTQYACIRGVNLLAARASALTVTIVLNVRKLASLLMSIWLFGNRLEMGTLVGAFIVFAAGGLYGLDGGGSGANKRGRRGKVG